MNKKTFLFIQTDTNKMCPTRRGNGQTTLTHGAVELQFSRLGKLIRMQVEEHSGKPIKTANNNQRANGQLEGTRDTGSIGSVH